MVENKGNIKGKWQDVDVEIVKPAQQGDAGFDPMLAIGSQVIVKFSDGSEKTVLRSDIVANPK